MARGWESKSIEEQLDAAREAREARARPVLSDAERQRLAKRKGLLISLARVRKDLEQARDERYRALLGRTLAHIEAELASLEALPHADPSTW